MVFSDPDYESVPYLDMVRVGLSNTLSKHQLKWYVGSEYNCSGSGCSWKIKSMDSLKITTAHRDHVAEMLIEVLATMSVIPAE